MQIYFLRILEVLAGLLFTVYYYYCYYYLGIPIVRALFHPQWFNRNYLKAVDDTGCTFLLINFPLYNNISMSFLGMG